MNGIKVVGVGGSMAQTSASLSALEIALAGAEAVGTEVHLFSIREMNLPIFVPTSPDVPDVARLQEKLDSRVKRTLGLMLYHHVGGRADLLSETSSEQRRPRAAREY